MKELTYFLLDNCPYCRAATAWVEELQREDPKYLDVPIKFIEESREVALADSYDYFYVPTFFLGDKKLHEGAATKEKIRDVLDAFLSAQA